MPRYIAVLKHDQASDVPNHGTTCFDKEAREFQISRLRNIREELVQKPLLASLGEDGRDVALPLTGIHLIDTESADREVLAERLPDHDIFEDEPLHLVEPAISGAPMEKPNDLWHLDAIGLTAARAAGFHNKGDGVGIAVLDTGILEVPEIKGRVKASYTLDSHGWTQVITHDTHGHGTHVAGLVAGSRVGVAPGAELTDVIMIPNGHGMLSDFVSALEFIAAIPDISILNMSAGIPGYHEGMHAAVQTVRLLGVLPVVAIGNEGRNTSRSPGNYREVLSVGAATKSNRVAGFSGGGMMVVGNQMYPIPDLVAPGEKVTSCIMDGRYESWEGTSMATPLVSGLAALVIAHNPTIKLLDLEQELIGALQELPGASNARQGGGLAQLPATLLP